MASALPVTDTSTLGSAAIGVGALAITLAAVSVALRFYTRFITRLGLWWDDWLILAAMAATLATAALVLAGNSIDHDGTRASAGTNPNYTLTAADALYMKLSYASSIVYFTSAGATKLGILLMYVRIFYISDGFHHRVALASTLVIAYWIGASIATLLTCQPLSYIWSDHSGFPLHCFNFNVFWMVMGACELFLDLMIITLPIRAVLHIRLSPRRQWSVVGIFLLGSFVVITDLVKIILAYNPNGHIPLSGQAEVWVTLHAGLAIVCACLPVLKPLITRDLKGSLTSEPEGWNIIHLKVDKRTPECGITSHLSSSCPCDLSMT